MLIVSQHPLLCESDSCSQQNTPADRILNELAGLANATDSLPDRSRLLYKSLRKLIGQPLLATYLLGLQELARRSEPAGARLLAAFLDANTPGARLVPSIHSFSSCRRLHLQLAAQQGITASLRQWDQRMRELHATCQRRSEQIPGAAVLAPDRPGNEPPFPYFRRCLRYLVASLYRQGDLAGDDTDLLVDLARLEVDAYQERISQLAGQVNPYRAAAVSRVLPLLSQADTEVRDLREFIGWLADGQIDRAFHQRQPRLYDVIENKEREAFVKAVSSSRGLEPLSELLNGLLRSALPIPQMATSVARLMALAHYLYERGLRRKELDLLTATRIVQQYEKQGELRLPLDMRMRAAVTEILASPQTGEGLGSWPLTGLYLEDDQLVLRPDQGGDRYWRDDLPTPPAEGERRPRLDDEADATAIKKLVLSNIGSISVLCGFLRNPKIVAIPGMVAAIVQRSRSLLVLGTIANERMLYSGFANKDVPRAMLYNPCNIPIKSLRKFIQVKYVAKVDLQRMARDKVGLRDEVAKEIAAYLKSLL